MRTMRIRMKWKAVVAFIAAFLIILFVIYLFLSRPPSHSFSHTLCENSYNEEDIASFNRYCNHPQQPADGSEGDVPSDDDGYQLKSVHVVIRHGDRSSLHEVPGLNSLEPFHCHFTPTLIQSIPGLEDYLRAVQAAAVLPVDHVYSGYALFPNKAICEIGDLTPEGAAQQFRNGLFLRRAYIDRHSLLPTTASEQRVFVRGTTISRTFQSAVAFMHGFLSPSLDISRVAFEMSRNNTMCMQSCYCPGVTRYIDMFSATYNQQEMRRTSEFARSIYDDLAEYLKVHASSLPKLSHIFDVGVTNLCHGVSLRGTSQSGCVNASLIRRLHDAVDRTGRAAVQDNRYVRIVKLKMSPLISEIGRRVRDQISEENVRRNGVKFVLYSSHDSTVSAFETALGIGDGTWPRYATRIVIELYSRRRDGVHFVRVLQDGAVANPRKSWFCSQSTQDFLGTLDDKNSMCPAETFVKNTADGTFRSLGESSYSAACMKSL